MSNEKSVYGTQVLTSECRILWPHLFEAHAFKPEDKPKFMCSLVFKKNDPFIVKLKSEALKVFQTKFEDSKVIKNLKEYPANLIGYRLGIRDADADPAFEKFDYLAGCYVIGVKSTVQPVVIDQNKQEILDASQVYGGCYVRALITPSAYDQKGGKGPNFYFSSLQKLRDGTPLSGGINKEKEMSAFDVVPMDNEIYN